MLLTYVDESYTDNWYTMAALMLDGPAAVGLADAMDQVAATAIKTFDLEPDIELHGFEIFQGRRHWSRVPPRARVGIFDDVVDAVGSQDLHVITRGLDLLGQQVRHSIPDEPYSVVLQHLLERVDEFVAEIDDYALVIADEVERQAKHRADLTRYRGAGTGDRQRRLSRIVDTLHFAPSHASRLVQAADMIAFLYRRTFTHAEGDERARKAKVAMWNRLKPKIRHDLCWFPSRAGQQDRWGTDFRQMHEEPARAGSKAGQKGPKAVPRSREYHPATTPGK